jgi:hypothetical protein
MQGRSTKTEDTNIIRHLTYAIGFVLLLIMLLIGCKKSQPTAPEEPQIPEGDFWESCATPDTGNPVCQFISGRNGILFSLIVLPYGLPGSVLRSVDTGRTWSVAASPIAFWNLVVDSAGNLYGAGDNVFRSTDNGTSWINLGGRGSEGDRFIAIFSNGWLWSSDAYGYGCYRSTNAGQSWVALGGLTNYALYVFVDKRTSTLYVNTTGHGNHAKIFSSSDYGDSWSLAQDFGGDMYTRRLAVDSTGRLLLLDSQGRLYRAFDDVPISQSLPAAGTTELQVHSSGKLLAGGAGFYISSNGGLSWLKKTSGMKATDTIVCGIGTLPDGRVLAGTSLGSIYRSKAPISN